MLEPLDRCRRDSTLFQFTSKRLQDFIDPNHLLIQIDEQLDFAKLMAPLEQWYWFRSLMVYGLLAAYERESMPVAKVQGVVRL